MIDSHLVQYDVRPKTGVLDLATPKTFIVDCHGTDSLFLQIEYVKNTSTALVFSFANDEAWNPASATKFKKYRTDYSALTAAPATVTVTIAATDNIEIPFSLTGLGIASGRVTVTVSATGGAAGDTVNITPIVARVA